MLVGWLAIGLPALFNFVGGTNKRRAANYFAEVFGADAPLAEHLWSRSHSSSDPSAMETSLEAWQSLQVDSITVRPPSCASR
jgi:hypothetical protein